MALGANYSLYVFGCSLRHFSLFSGSKKERQVYEKAQHHNKLQQRGEKPGLNLKVFYINQSFIIGF